MTTRRQRATESSCGFHDRQMSDNESISSIEDLARWASGAFVALLCVGILVVAWSESVPGMLFRVWIVGVALVGTLGLIWVVHVVAALRGFGLVATVKASPARLLSAPIVVLIAVVLIYPLDGPLRARFVVSRSDFDRIASQIEAVHESDLGRRAAGSELEGLQSIGSFTIDDVWQVGDVVLFFSGSEAYFPSGFAYVPLRSRPGMESGFNAIEGPDWIHLGGDWFAFKESS